MQSMATENAQRFMRINEVINITALPRQTIYHYIAAGQFPKPIKLGERSAAWIESEVRQWMNERIEAARA
jgi:prophage regulatory protein